MFVLKDLWNCSQFVTADHAPTYASLSLSHTHIHTRALPLSVTLAPSHTHTHTLSLSLSLSLSETLTGAPDVIHNDSEVAADVEAQSSDR